MRPAAEVDEERRVAILAHAPLLPKGTCHFCAWLVPKLAIWCRGECAKDYEDEKAALLVK